LGIYLKTNTPISVLLVHEYKNTNKSISLYSKQKYMFSYQLDTCCSIFYEKLNFFDIFNKHKSRVLDLNRLLIGLVSFKLTENFSIKEAGKWLNQEATEIQDIN
jgi:transposase